MRTAAPPAPPSVSEREAPRRSASRGFDGLVAVLSAVFGGGLYLDGWAHVHGHVHRSFFTPWHAALYSGFLVVAAVIGGTALAGMRRGLPLRESVPTGYELSLLGAGIFLVGGVADMAWHIVFYRQALGVSGVIIQTAVVMAFVLLAARRFVLPFGALTAILGLNALALSFLGRQVGGLDGGLGLVPAALVAGLLADTLYAAL